MSATQQTIADQLGISQRLVSYALTGNVRVSTETRTRVLQAAKELNYRPNKAARALAVGSAHQVAVWVHSLREAYAVQIQECVRAAVNEDGFDLIVRSGDEPHPSNSLLDGMITLNSPTVAPESEKEWAQGVPVVMMGTLPHVGAEGFDCVGVDLKSAAAQAVQHLLSVGCQRVAYLAADELLVDAEPRYAAYRNVMRKAGRPIELICIKQTSSVRTDSKNSLMGYVQSKGAPDGLLCSNDHVALGAFRALHALGLRVPEDVKVIGCDDIDDAGDADPSLSTISLLNREMSRAAWELLKLRLKDPYLPPQSITLSAKLILRDSSRRI